MRFIKLTDLSGGDTLINADAVTVVQDPHDYPAEWVEDYPFAPNANVGTTWLDSTHVVENPTQILGLLGASLS